MYLELEHGREAYLKGKQAKTREWRKAALVNPESKSMVCSKDTALSGILFSGQYIRFIDSFISIPAIPKQSCGRKSLRKATLLHLKLYHLD